MIDGRVARCHLWGNYSVPQITHGSPTVFREVFGSCFRSIL